MPYTKQFAISTGQPAIAADLIENFEDMRRYINQQVVEADLSSATVGAPEIVRGELTTFSGPEHQFTCGNGYGIFKNTKTRNYSGFSSTTKQEYAGEYADQSAAGLAPPTQQITSQILTLSNTFKRVELEHRAIVTYRAFLDVLLPQVVIPDAADTTGATIPEHRYTTFMYLSLDGGATTLANTTKGRFFDESLFSSPWAGGPSSWAGPQAQDPMRDQSIPDGYANNIPSEYYRRQYVIYKCIELAPGSYDIGVVADAHHSKGYVKTHNVTIECEYVDDNI